MKNYIVLIFFLISTQLLGQAKEDIIDNIRQLNASQEITIAQVLSDPTGKYLANRTKENNSISSNYSGPGNYSSITQNGNYNVSEVDQTGSSNYYELSLNGNYNESLVILNGSELSTSISQFGNNNIVRQNITGNEKNYSFTQSGNGNELIQSSDGLSKLSGLEVIQRGNNMKLIINNSSFYK